MIHLPIKDYYNTIGLQIEALQDIVDAQADSSFDTEKLKGLLPLETMRGIKRVVITGCGDSYSAAGAMLPSFRENSGIALSAAPDPMEFCRFYTKEETLKGFKPEEVLVIAVSASGGSARIVEIMDKGKRLGTNTMLITNNPESAGGKAAKTVFNAQTPPGCNSPGLRSYFASMLCLQALGAWFGVVKGTLDMNRFQGIKQLIVEHVKGFAPYYDAIDRQMFDLAGVWKEFDRFEIIGDWDEAYSAQFVEEKFIECAGVHCTHTNSEDWCHVNFFLKNPEGVGTVFHAPYRAENFDRVMDAVSAAVNIGRPTLVVTDAPASALPEGALHCALPAPKEVWLAPIVDFAPGSMLGAYIAARSDKLFFTGRYDFRTQTWVNM